MQLEFQENQVIVWVMESPRIFRRYAEELMAQADGAEGGFTLSEKDCILDMRQKAEVVLSPYMVDLNDKRCLGKLYAELKELAYGEQYYMQTQSILAQLQSYLLGLEQDASIELNYAEPDLTQIFKVCGIKPDVSQQDLVTRLAQYLKAAVRLLDKKVIFFVNLSFYMTVDELEALLKEAFYLKIAVVLIESHEINFSVCTKCYTIDKDNCEIF